MMNKKNYEEIAKVFEAEVIMIQHLQDSFTKRSAAYSVRNIIFSLADVMKKDNPNFDKVKFYSACGLTFDAMLGWNVLTINETGE